MARPHPIESSDVLRCLQAWGMVLVLFVAPAVPAQAQNAVLSGKVTDDTDGSPLELVNVALTDSDGNVRGTVTNQDGLFLIARISPGRFELHISRVGYGSFADTLELSSDERRTINVTMQPSDTELDELVVESERTGGAANLRAGRQTVRPAEIELVPAPDLTGDLVHYLTMLPGVVSTGDRGGQLFIRGGEPSQNLILLDGIPLFQPFHLVGFYSAFPADIIDHTDVYAGGFGGKYGDRLSSVIDVASRIGNNRQFAGAAAVSPFVNSARLEGPIATDRLSFLLSARRSMIERTAPYLIDRSIPFVFDDVFAKVHAEPGRRSRLSATALHTYDRGTVGETVTGVASEEVRWKNQAIGLRYLTFPRLYPVISDLHVSVSRLDSELGPPDAPTRRSQVRNIRVWLNGTFPGEHVSVDAGWTFDQLRFRSDLGGLYQNVELRASRLNHLAFYVEPEFRWGGLTVRPSTRLQFYFARDRPIFEPRLRAVWGLGAHQLSAAAGMYLQEFIGLSDRRDAASIFTVWTNTPKATDRHVDDALSGRLPRAFHAIAGYQLRPTPGLELSVEGFYKHLTDLFVAEWTAFPRFTTRLQRAHGRSRGLDVRVELRRSPLYLFLSYGLSSTRYEAEQAALELWYGVEHLRFRPPHDRRHQLNALAAARIWGFDVSMRWAFGSGLPFSQPIGFDGFALIDAVERASEIIGSRRVIYERPFNGTLPTYHRLDVAVQRSFAVGAASIAVQLSAINLYDRRNLFYLDTFTLQRVDQLPFVPSLGVEVAFR